MLWYLWTCLIYTTQIFNISPIFSISIPISISKFPKISISISKSIFWKCIFQYQYQNQYFETAVFNIKININMTKILTFQNFSKFCPMSGFKNNLWAQDCVIWAVHILTSNLDTKGGHSENGHNNRCREMIEFKLLSACCSRNFWTSHSWHNLTNGLWTRSPNTIPFDQKLAIFSFQTLLYFTQGGYLFVFRRAKINYLDCLKG